MRFRHTLRVLGSIVLFYSVTNSVAQSIQNVHVVVMGDNVNITYDLVSQNQNQLFELRLYASYNNFTAPLTKVSGEIGQNIKPGLYKLIIWRAAEELTNYKGDITFKVRGSVTGEVQPVEVTPPPPVETPPALNVINPRSGSSFKVGRSVPLQWNGGFQNENIKIELFKGQMMMRNIGTSPNNGNFNWTVPQDIKGSDFRIKLFNLNRPESAVFSGGFKIKGKMSMLVKIGIPVLALGGAAAALLSGGDGGGGNGPPPPDRLPDPPPLPPGG